VGLYSVVGQASDPIQGKLKFGSWDCILCGNANPIQPPQKPCPTETLFFRLMLALPKKSLSHDQNFIPILYFPIPEHTTNILNK
jgi:hypothetical protein